jgi:NADPH2:quinone reductase
MRAVWYEQTGPADQVLQYGEMPDPQLQAGEVRVAVRVSGVNPIDVKRRLGGRGAITAPRVVPHFDGAGVIDAVGQGVDPNRIGERVWLYEAQWHRDFGTAAEFVTLPAALAVPLPERVSFAEGACLGIPALTAYGAVFGGGDVADKSVLVTGGAGAVGRYAVQFAKLAGATAFATVSSDEKQQSALAAGADRVFNYRAADVAEEVLAATAGQGVDLVVEVEFGGNLATNLRCVRTGGTLAAYASQARPEPTLPFYSLMYRSLVIRHVLVFQLPDALKQQAVADISQWLAGGQLTHQIAERFSLENTVSAHLAVERGTLGKVLIEVSKDR